MAQCGSHPRDTVGSRPDPKRPQTIAASHAHGAEAACRDRARSPP
jgi:hypothetical protein